MERKHIFILLYRRDTWNQDTTGALFTRKQDVGNHVTVFLNFMQISSSWDNDWEQRRKFFIKKKKGVFFPFFSQYTRHVLGAQKVYGKSYITGINFKLFIK